MSTTSETINWHTLRHSPALDNEELFVVDGSQKIIALKTGTRRPSGRESEKWRKMRPKPASKSLMTGTEAPPTVSGNCANLSLRDHGDVHTLSMNCKTGTSTTLGSTATAENLHCFQHWLNQARHLSLKNNGRVNCLPKNCAVESASSAQFALCMHVSVASQHSGDEQNLRHFNINRHGLRCMFTETSKTVSPEPCPVFVYRLGQAVSTFIPLHQLLLQRGAPSRPAFAHQRERH